MGSEKRKTWSAIKSAAFRRAVAKIERLTAELEQAKRHAFRAGALWTLERVQDEISRARTALAAPELSEECSPVTLAHLVLTANEIAQAAQEYRDVRREIEAGMAGPGVTVGAENKTPEQDMADFSALVERERRAAKRLDAALAARSRATTFSSSSSPRSSLIEPRARRGRLCTAHEKESWPRLARHFKEGAARSLF